MVDCSPSSSRSNKAPLHALANSLVSESKFGRRGNIAQRDRLFPTTRTAPSPILNMFTANRVCREDQYSGYGSFEDMKYVEFSSHPQQGQHSARLHGARGHSDTFEKVWTQSSASPAAETIFPPPIRHPEGTNNHSEHSDQNLDNAFSRSLAVSDPIIADIFHRYRPANWDPAEGDEDGLRHAAGNTNSDTQHQHVALNSSDKARPFTLRLDVADYMRYHESQEIILPAVFAAQLDKPTTPMTTSQTDYEPGIRKAIFWANEPCRREEDEDRRDLSVIEWDSQQERNETFLGAEWCLANPGRGDDMLSSDIAEKRLRVVLGHLSSTN
ncbi:hypothetical protein BG000_011874 [Podila horticola]|nr:hypothetical protein BG000_011874 [Podila horticola]